MDFPIFQADFIGNRFLIGLIAVVHVIINHGFAVGMMPLLTFMEWWAHRTALAAYLATLQRTNDIIPSSASTARN